MTTLVTGATGFLGGALAHSLVQQGEHVRILARQPQKLRHLEGLPIEVAYGRLEDRASLAQALAGVERVYHCAAVATDWAPWMMYYQANVQGVQNLLEEAIKTGWVQRFVHISTTDVYGYPVQACDETHPLIDIGLPYNRTKVQGEKLVWKYSQETGLPVTILRPADIYGPRSITFVADIANYLYQKQGFLVDGGRVPAGWLYIDNAVEAIIQAANSPNTIGQAYNLRDETKETWKDYIEALAGGLGIQAAVISLPGWLALVLAYLSEAVYRLLPLRGRPILTRHAVYLLMRDQCYGIEKARRDFGFCSRVSFAEGIERSVAWLDTEEGRAAVPARKA